MKGHHGNPTISFEVMALRTPAGLAQIPGIVSTTGKTATARVRGFENVAIVQIEYVSMNELPYLE